MKEHHTEASDGDADWPYVSLFFFGFFGADTPAGKRLVWQSSAALIVILLAFLMLGGFPQLLPRIVGALAIPAAVGVIFWANARYLATLDELSRAIHLRGFAFSYGATMVLASALLAIGLAIPVGAAAMGPVPFLALLVLVEPLRGLALVFFAKKYR